MPRLAALLLCALAALVASATPAPEPKPWVTGWEEPVDPKGDCRFERRGDDLTITVPGEGYELDMPDCLDAPRLLRDVEGDFAAEVRVSEGWASKQGKGYRVGGILVMGDEKDPILKLEFEGSQDDGQATGDPWYVRREVQYPDGSAAGRYYMGGLVSPPRMSTYLRLERRGNVVRMSHSQDRKEWTEGGVKLERKLPRKLKVGVLAEGTAEGEFKVTFDHFKLSRPAK